MSTRIDKALRRLRNLEVELPAALARAEAAERRVAELEARLAEQEWRPVTEDAPTYMIVDLLVTGYNTEDGYMVGPDNTDVIKAWRPSQPEPQSENVR